jgi:carboxymethylenebutenolidase
MPDIAIQSPDGRFSAYLASPPSKAGPGVLVIQEIFGVNKDMREHCDTLAAAGYVALCPDLFWRQQPGVQLTDKTEAEWQRAMQFYQGFDVDKGIADLKVALGELRTVAGCSGTVGTVGFCLGGLLAYLMATRSDADCNVGYYGVGIEGKLDEAKNITHPLMLHIAEEDEYCPKDAQRQIKDGLAGNAQVTLHSYSGMNHAFARHNGIHYDAANAQLANERTAAFFKQHLGL